jgi:small conductance mechanosensitive channel
MESVLNLLETFNLVDMAYALILFLVGWGVIARLKRRLPKWISKLKIDDTLKPFTSSFITMGLKVLLIIAVIQKIGIETTSLVAVLGAASFAVGLAFQGTLSNFASGVLLLTLRPFKVGDYIEAAGFAGTVETIQMFTTQLVTPDHKVAIIPNSVLSNSSILNYSIKETRRLDFNFTVSYTADLTHVKSVLTDLVRANPLVLQEPEPFIAINAHGNHAIGVLVRVWVKSSDYWPVNFKMYEDVKVLFDKEAIEIPYPQLDLHLHGMRKEDVPV